MLFIQFDEYYSPLFHIQYFLGLQMFHLNSFNLFKDIVIINCHYFTEYTLLLCITKLIKLL